MEVEKIISKFERQLLLENYYGCKPCFLELKKDFSYQITDTKGKTIKIGNWDIYGTPYIILLDEKILGFDNLKLYKPKVIEQTTNSQNK